MVAPELTTAMEPLTAMTSTFNNFQISVLAGFCSDLLANETLFSRLKIGRNKLHPFRSRWMSVVVLQDESFKANFCISQLRRSSLVGVDASRSGFMEAGSRRSLGLRPMANSMGVFPIQVTCVFLTVAALRINWVGVI